MRIEGELLPRTAFIVTNLRKKPENVVRFYDKRGNCEQYMKEGKYAPAETVIGLHKTEVIRNRGPWRNLDEVEYATLEWVDWFDHRRILEPVGNIPPAEFEAYYWGKEGQEKSEGLKRPCLR